MTWYDLPILLQFWWLIATDLMLSYIVVTIMSKYHHYRNKSSSSIIQTLTHSQKTLLLEGPRNTDIHMTFTLYRGRSSIGFSFSKSSISSKGKGASKTNSWNMFTKNKVYINFDPFWTTQGKAHCCFFAGLLGLLSSQMTPQKGHLGHKATTSRIT